MTDTKPITSEFKKKGFTSREEAKRFFERHMSAGVEKALDEYFLENRIHFKEGGSITIKFQTGHVYAQDTKGRFRSLKGLDRYREHLIETRKKWEAQVNS